MGSISITQLLVISVIVVLLFSTKKLRTLDYDLGASCDRRRNATANPNG